MKKTFLRIGGSLLILCAGYSVMWWKAAHQLEDQVQAFFTDVTKQGWSISYDTFQIRGFPFKLEGMLKNPSLNRQDFGSVIVKTDGKLYVASSLFRSNVLTFSSEGKTYFVYTFDTPEHKIDLTGDHMEGEVSLVGQRFNRSARLILENVEMRTPFNQTKVEYVKLENVEVDMPARLKMIFEARQINPGLKLSPPFDQKIRLINLTTRLDLEGKRGFGDIPTLLKALAHEGGTFEIEKAEIDWGDLALNASGTLTLDELKQPIASFGATVKGLDKILDQLVKLRLVKPQVAQIAKLTLFVFKEPSSVSNEPSSHKISLSFQNGELSVGSIPLMRFSPKFLEDFLSK